MGAGRCRRCRVAAGSGVDPCLLTCPAPTLLHGFFVFCLKNNPEKKNLLKLLLNSFHGLRHRRRCAHRGFLAGHAANVFSKTCMPPRRRSNQDADATLDNSQKTATVNPDASSYFEKYYYFPFFILLNK